MLTFNGQTKNAVPLSERPFCPKAKTWSCKEYSQENIALPAAEARDLKGHWLNGNHIT
jgi:hypothetical protein